MKSGKADSATRRTSLQETLFATGYAISQITHRNITKQQILNNGLFVLAFNKYVRSNTSVVDTYHFAVKEPTWVSSVVLGVNRLRNSTFMKGDYKIYRGVGIMYYIYKAKELLIKKVGVRLADDKWNPGDLWFSRLISLPRFGDILELNKFVSDNLKSGELVSVSLKKSFTPNIEYIQQTDTPVKYQYRGVHKPTTPFTTGISIHTNTNYSINIRSFNIKHIDDITTELTLRDSSPKHGKWWPKSLITNYRIPQMGVGEISRLINTQDILITLITDLWKVLGHTWSNEHIRDYWTKKQSKGFGNEVGYFKSIINSLEMGVFIHQHGGYSDDMVTKIITEASSKGDLASEYLKVS